MKHIIMVVSAISAGVVLASCGDKPPESAGQTIPPTASPSAQTQLPASIRAIPRDGVPDVLETMEGGSYVTGSNMLLGERTVVKVMYSVNKAPAEVIAFYQASFTKNGFTASAPKETVKPDGTSTYMEAKGPDGRLMNVQAIQDTGSAETIVDVSHSESARK